MPSSSDTSSNEEDNNIMEDLIPAIPSTSTSSIAHPPSQPPRVFKQPYLESYFPPSSNSNIPSSSVPSKRNGRNKKPSSSSTHQPNRRKTTSAPSGGSSSSHVPKLDEENLQTAIVLNNRDLEIFVTLPSAEKRLFVDVQEEIHYLPSSSSSSAANGQGSTLKTKKRKVEHRQDGGQEKVDTASNHSGPSTSTVAATADTTSMQVDKITENDKGKEKASKSTSTPLKAKDPNSTSTSLASTGPTKSGTSSLPIPTLSQLPDNAQQKDKTLSISQGKSTKNQGNQEDRIPYSTFEHVKLNVRVKQPITSSTNKESREKKGGSSGVSVAALPKPVVQPKAIDRFPIRIFGSTTRPTAIAGLQDTFDLSVQGSTDISSLLVLLYTRIKLSLNSTSSSSSSFFAIRKLELNAIRLWHLEEDKLIRLSIGNIASNCITPKSILCYTVAKPLGKSFVDVYADDENVERVEVEMRLSRTWVSKEQVEGLEESKPPNAPRRQLFKFKHDLLKSRHIHDDDDEDEDENDSRNKAPYKTSFTIPLLAELNDGLTPLDAALAQARTEHEERTAEKKRIKQEREAEREKEIARLEIVRKRLQRKNKNMNSNSNGGNEENLANDGFVVVHSIDGPSTSSTRSDESAGSSSEQPTGVSHADDNGESDDESDWCSDTFCDEWCDSHDPLDDECDDDLPFRPHEASVAMEESVLLASAARPTVLSSTSISTSTEASTFDTNPTPSSTIVGHQHGIPSVQDGVEHMLTSLGVPRSARQAFVKEFVKTTSVYPYIAVKLVSEQDTAFAVDLEAKYQPIDEAGTYWDIKDIQQVCLVYKGVWKSEVEDWKKGCKNVYCIDWPKIALGEGVRETIARPSNIAPVPTAITVVHTPPPATAVTTSAATQTSTVKTAEQRFNQYRMRTAHRRLRTCPACDSEFCNHSRHIDSDCDCGECDGEDDGEDDEFFKYYDLSQATSSTTAQSVLTLQAGNVEVEKETIASVMIPGHRARVVQCIFLEAF